MATLIKLREKYTVKGAGGKPGGTYRTRTGPNCCTANCPSGRKKSNRMVKEGRR